MRPNNAVLGFAFLILMSFSLQTRAQDQEFGAWAGMAYYIGDLNADYNLQAIRPAAGIMYRYNYSSYLGFKAGISYARLGAKDSYSSNPFPQARNLSFKTNVYELNAQVEFNFKKYIPGDENHAFTPYISFGIGMLYFNPKAEYNGETFNLVDIGTEGQLNTDITGVEPYRLLQPVIPIGLGFKYWTKGNWTMGFELSYHHTFTDYLDDVKGTYVDDILFGNASITSQLSDRSPENDIVAIAEAGKQRGDSVSKDGYLTAGLNITYAIFSVKCPGKRFLSKFE